MNKFNFTNSLTRKKRVVNKFYWERIPRDKIQEIQKESRQKVDKVVKEKFNRFELLEYD